MKIALADAVRLFPEAEAYENGGYVSEDSELRTLAEETFNNSFLSALSLVTKEVYRTLANAYISNSSCMH